MAYAQTNIGRLYQGGLKSRIQQLRTSIRRRAERRAVYLRTYNELNTLSDRDLADFGFHRSEIAGISRKAAEKA
ncbi:DUF1127 domain-containing protein [Roseisalinus antarcticus]|uniref:YjiS-like domain-containing protein n=1 Tax=Roseisalinus antarcticus TaxID=254357 RepID=A0A1Y5TXB1_9RHOB|nr:DUF1127 domain-containing protein [Roseisalinus antarcticus]SLN75657.1 hypothetical protein ROA7023_04011 [Roseisalinus antarcticus]